MNLKILYINDLHSRFEEFVKLSSAIENIRDNNTLIFDAGDSYDEWRVEAIGTKGKISSDLLNKANFSARVIGNTEGFSGRKTLENLVTTSKFPVLTCNVYDLEGNKLTFLKDYHIFEVGLLKILVIGVTGAFNEFYNLFNIHIKDPLKELKRVLSSVDRTEYNMLIVISHLGLEQDKHMTNAIHNIDVIIGGHSHSVLEECLIENKTIICQAGSFGKYLGKLEIAYNLNDDRIEEFKNELIVVDNLPINQKMHKVMLKNSKTAHKNMGKHLFKIERKFPHSYTNESQLGNLLADALRHFLNSDLGIINSGVLNSSIDNRNITELLLHKLCPSPLNPTLVEIKGCDIKLTLEKSLLEEYQLSNGAGPGFRGSILGNIQVSNNVKVVYNPSNQPLNRIISIEIDNMPLIPNRWYKAATSDYLQRGTGYEDFGNCKNEVYSPELLKDILELYLKRSEFLELAISKRFIELQE